MRFSDIHIPAFGPFTDFSLSLPKTKSEHDLHLIYGANEQGKSSLLRSVDHLLFGIPTRTNDNFLHQNPKLRIGATIESSEKKSLTFLRKKGNTNTLLSEKGDTLPNSELTSFLGPVTQNFFGSMFGLTTESLRKGAQALIAGEGKLGDALFSASLGNTPIDSAIDAFEAEAAALFKATGTRNSIAEALAAYKDCLRSAKNHSVTVTAWKAHRKELALAQTAFDKIDSQLIEHSARRLTLERTLNALPNIYRLQRIETELDSLSYLPPLPSDFISQVRAAQEEAHQLTLQLKNNEEGQKNITKKLGRFTFRKDVLDAETEITALHQLIPLHLENLNSMRVLLDLPPDLPTVTDHLLSDYTRISTDLRTHDEKLTNGQAIITQLEEEQTALSEEISNTPRSEDSSALEALASKVHELEANRSRLDELIIRETTLTRKASQLTSRLQLSSLENDFNAIPSLSVPSAGSIRVKAEAEQTLTTNIQNLREQLSTLNDQIADENSHLSLLKKQLPLTSHEELIKSRKDRDLLIEKSLNTGKISPEIPTAVSTSDNLADSLHTHAENITKANTHQVRLEKLEIQRDNTKQNLTENETSLKDYQARWCEDLKSAHLPLLSSQDFISWREDWASLCELIDDLSTTKEALTQIQIKTSELTQKLQTTLVSQSDDFSTLAAELKQRITDITKSSGSYQTLIDHQKSLSKKHREYTQAFIKIQTTHDSLTQQLAEITAPFPVGISIQEIYEAQAQKALEQKIKTTQERINSLSVYLLKKEDLPPDNAVAELWRLLNEEKNKASQAQATKETLIETQNEYESLSLAHRSASEILDSLRRNAEVENFPALEKTLTAIEEKSKLTNAAEDLKDSLAEVAGGSLTDFIALSTAQSETDLKQEQHELDLSLPILQNERDESRAQLQELLRQDKEFSSASSQATEFNQQAQLHLSSLTTDAKRFTQLQYAIHFLRDQIDIYRQRTQGPMLIRTSEIFSKLTCGAFTHVAAQLNEKGDPVLIGVRKDSSEVPPQHMSEGTADQLYLALRLAAIAEHLKTHPPMPLILDDLLMTFDDERIQALLPLLTALSKKTQILVFTHHKHLEKLFETTVSKQFTHHCLA